MPCIIGSKFDGNIDNKLKTDYVWIPSGTANYGPGRRYGRALHSGTLGLSLNVPHVANKSHGWTLEMYIKDLNNYGGPLFGFGNSGNMFAIDMNGNFRLVYWGGMLIVEPLLIWVVGIILWLQMIGLLIDYSLMGLMLLPVVLVEEEITTSCYSNARDMD